jgi:hypothetical protein
VSSRAVLSGVHVSWGTPAECENSAGAVRRILVVGKQTTSLNRNRLALALFPSEWFTSVGSFHRPSCLFPAQYRRLAPTWIKSTLPTSQVWTACNTLGRPALKLLALHDLASGIKRTPLTKANSPGYGSVQKGGLRCKNSAAKASVSVPGTLDKQGRELGS